MKLTNIFLWIIGKQKAWILTRKDGTEEIYNTQEEFEEAAKSGYSHYVIHHIKRMPRVPIPSRDKQPIIKMPIIKMPIKKTTNNKSVSEK